MKKIGLISGTLGHWDDKFEEHFKDCDEVWHAGDIGSMELAAKFEEMKPFRAVYGNIDDFKVRLAYPEILKFEIEKVDIIMTHIGGYPGKYAPSIFPKLKANRPKLFIAGHSHILKVMYDEKIGTLHMNPGAAGLYGFHKVRTLLRFVLDNGNIRDLEVIELGTRG